LVFYNLRVRIFDFDSGGQPFFQRDSPSPPPWRLSPESVFTVTPWMQSGCGFNSGGGRFFNGHPLPCLLGDRRPVFFQQAVKLAGLLVTLDVINDLSTLQKLHIKRWLFRNAEKQNPN
jgi:hypothetical protein